MVVGQDNKIQYRLVTLGPLVDGLRVARSGLAPGDRVVVNGIQRVRPGMTVTPTTVAMDLRDGGAPGGPAPTARAENAQ